MVIIAALIAFFVLFFFCRKHTGPAHLAMIAGLTVYEMFGKNFSETLLKLFDTAPLDLIQTIVYLVLVLFFPLFLYFRSARGGLGGFWRIIEAGIFSALLTALITPILSQYLDFDVLATEISTFIADIEGIIVLVGVISAYFDILFYHD